MVRAVSKYCLLSISPPQSQFERHNAVKLQPITERRTRPLHRRSSAPYICMRRGYLGLRSTTCAPRSRHAGDRAKMERRALSNGDWIRVAVKAIAFSRTRHGAAAPKHQSRCNVWMGRDGEFKCG